MGDDEKRCMYGVINYEESTWEDLLIYLNIALAMLEAGKKWGVGLR